MQVQQIIAQSWRWLKSPQLTAVLLMILAAVVALWLWLPPAAPVAAWTSALPPVIQPWGPALYAAGLAQIFQSLWLWLPLAGLLLHALVALADYAPPSWLRFQNAPASLEWQHPLACRVEASVRLPASPDDYLAALKAALVSRGFRLHPNPDSGRGVSAVRQRGLWLAVIAVYAAIIGLVAAFLLTFISLQTESLSLWPAQPANSDLFASAVELYQVDVAATTGTVVVTPADAGQPALALYLKPFRPVLFKQMVVWATAINPALTITAEDATGQLRRLMPVQTDMPPAMRLSLPLAATAEPLYFLIPSAKLAFQILPVDDGGFNVQVRRGNEAAPSENLMVQPGHAFKIDGLSITLTAGYSLNLVIRRDFGLPLYLLAGLMLILGALGVWLLPPWQVWLIPEVRGRGGQLFGVVEKLGSSRLAVEFLAQLLAPPETETEPETAVETEAAGVVANNSDDDNTEVA